MPHLGQVNAAGRPYAAQNVRYWTKGSSRSHPPACRDRREYVQVGGLISYGASVLALHRRIGMYVGRVLKGEKPADLPVMLPEKFELAINLKSAKALGITVPPSLLATANEVIE
jgi:putative ABC transport system substrate-binding protein